MDMYYQKSINFKAFFFFPALEPKLNPKCYRQNPLQWRQKSKCSEIDWLVSREGYQQLDWGICSFKLNIPNFW